MTVNETRASIDSSYDAFSWFYERHWCEEVPPAIFTVIERLLLPSLPSASRILDLCCGTGYTTARLERMGYNVTGLDASEKMLRYARQHAPRSGFVQADARSFDLPQSFDAVISTFDSLNHLMTLEELRAAMACTHRSLRPGGLFLFDMNMESGFLNHWADYFSIVEGDEACILRGHYDRGEKLGRYDITMFRRRGEVWERSDTVITERCYSMKEIKGALRQSGFAEAAVFDAERDMGLADHTGRKFFLARKEEN
ncbi:MAG TPA: class I SAM-dependent methyltransferase [Pyrinomonadaceae bacterium]|nr:class I SAM-dependent methyltransferase [Pyrinomonadaceae bacterium]